MKIKIMSDSNQVHDFGSEEVQRDHSSPRLRTARLMLMQRVSPLPPILDRENAVVGEGPGLGIILEARVVANEESQHPEQDVRPDPPILNSIRPPVVDPEQNEALSEYQKTLIRARDNLMFNLVDEMGETSHIFRKYHRNVQSLERRIGFDGTISNARLHASETSTEYTVDSMEQLGFRFAQLTEEQIHRDQQREQVGARAERDRHDAEQTEERRFGYPVALLRHNLRNKVEKEYGSSVDDETDREIQAQMALGGTITRGMGGWSRERTDDTVGTMIAEFSGHISIGQEIEHPHEHEGEDWRAFPLVLVPQSEDLSYLDEEENGEEANDNDVQQESVGKVAAVTQPESLGLGNGSEEQQPEQSMSISPVAVDEEAKRGRRRTYTIKE